MKITEDVRRYANENVWTTKRRFARGRTKIWRIIKKSSEVCV